MKRGLILITLLLQIFLGWHVLAFATAGEGPFLILVHGDHLTVRAIDIPLKRVVDEITRQMDTMDIRTYGEPQAADEKITVEFYDLPIHEGLAKMLDGYNVVHVYSPAEEREIRPSPYRLTEVWVFYQRKDKVASSTIHQTGHQRGVESSGSRDQNGQGPAAVRSAAIETHVDRGSRGGDIVSLMNLLKDPDPTVRLAAIESLSGLSLEVPAKDLKELADVALKDDDPRIRLAILTSTLALPPEMVMYHALHDPDPRVRVVALHAMRWTEETKSKVKGVVQQAMNDTDEVVHDRAEEIMRFILGIDG